MLVTDGQAISFGALIAPLNKSGVSLVEGVFAHTREKIVERGRSRTNPKAIVADRAYDSERLRVVLRVRGI